MALALAATYTVAHGVLRQGGQAVRLYLPAAYPQIATDLAKLHEGDEAAVLAYAQSWGLLGYEALVMADQSCALEERQRRAAIGGDPLPWIWAHARGARVSLDLLRYLKGLDDPRLAEGLGEYLGSLVPAQQAEGWPVVRYGQRHLSRQSQFMLAGENPEGEDPPGRLARLARAIIVGIVNANLAGVRPELGSAGAVGQLGIHYSFTALVDLAYWHLARLVVGELGLGRCQECGAYFPKTDARQRFCPPEEWKIGRPESRCAARMRARLHRLRKGEAHE